MVWSSSRDHAVRGGRRFESPCSADKEASPGSLGLGPALASRFQRLRTASSERPGSRPAMTRHFCPSSATLLCPQQLGGTHEPFPGEGVMGGGLGREASVGAKAEAIRHGRVARGVWRVARGVWRVVCGA
eukprot:scaffold123264_cov62-Phaeocystis_antarctica.AAC.1